MPSCPCPWRRYKGEKHSREQTMSSGTSTKSAGTTAADVCRNFELSQEAQKLLQPNLAPRPFLDILLAHQLYPDAAKLMAHALPRREAIWWGCLCAQKAYGSAPPPKQGTALQAAEKWVVQPTDEHRRATFQVAEAAEFKNRSEE